MRHVLDKPILRDLFWFVVLPHRLQEWLRAGKLSLNRKCYCWKRAPNENCEIDDCAR